MTLTIDAEFQGCIPPLQTDELANLEASLLAEGCRDALVVWREHNILVDGHNRYALCQKHGLAYRVDERDFESRDAALVWIIQNQFSRRNVSAFWRSKLALKQKDIVARQAKARQAHGQTAPGKSLPQSFAEAKETREQLGELADVSRETIRKVEVITTSAPAYIEDMAETGDLSTDKAYKLTRALQDVSPFVRAFCEQHHVTDVQLIALLEAKQDTETAKAFFASGTLQSGDAPVAARDASAWDFQGELRRSEREHRRAAQDKRIESALNKIEGAPDEVFSVVYADPAWQYDNSGLYGAAEDHYATMPTEQICQLPTTIHLTIADDAVLFLWATNPLLPDALRVVEAWGFTYKTNLVWVKDKPTPGLGFYVHGQHEFLIVATRGSFLPTYKPPSVVLEKKGAHSQKPPMHALIETMYPRQRYIELFARFAQPRDGWAFWGKEKDVSQN